MERASRTLAGVELFRDLDSKDCEALGAACLWRSYGAGEQIVGRSEQSTDIFFVVSGDARAVAYSLDGKEVSFRDLGAGKCFGELAAIDGAPRSADVVALSDALIASMPAQAFWTVLRKHPEVSENLLKQLSGLARKLSERVFEFSVLAVRNRIHAEILRMAREHANGGNAATIFPAPIHAGIASRISTHREAVTKELNALDRNGVIERRQGMLIVPDLARLAGLVKEVGES